MDAEQTRETLAFAEHARKRARDDMGRPWLPLVLLGSLSVASLSLTNSATTPTGLFWVFAGPLGAATIAIYAYRRTRANGIETSPLAYVAITAGLLILAFAAGKIAFAFQVPGLGRIGPPLVVAAGYLVLAWIERNWMVAAVAIALITVTLVTAGLDLSSVQSNSILFAFYGLTLLVVGFSMRVQRLKLP
jgi:hypothetical protein